MVGRPNDKRAVPVSRPLTYADEMINRFLKSTDTVWKLVFACALVFAVSFALSLVAIWLLPAGEVVGNILRAIAAVISALLILAFINRRTSTGPGQPQK